MIADGQALMDKVTSNSINLFERITTYAPILLTAEDAINGSVRVDDERITAETLGLSRAVGARGQMMMQQLLVNLGGELPEPELRTRMFALAGTEPSTLFGMSQVLGVGSAEAQQLQGEMVKRLAIMSDPAAVLVNNPELRASEAITDQIAGQIITDTTASVTSTVEERAAAQRTAAIRDAAIVGGAMLLALIVVIVVARYRSCGLFADCVTVRCGSPMTIWPAKSSRCVPVEIRGRSIRFRCTPPMRWGRSRTPSTSCTSRRYCWPASSRGCSCRSATCSRPCRAAVAHWSTSSCRSSTGSSATRRTRSGWRAFSASTTWPPGCAATAPTCWCSPARRCLANRRSRCPFRRSSTRRPRRSRTTPASSPRRCPTASRRIRRGRSGSSAGRAARQRVALFTSDLPGAGVRSAYRQRRPRHRGQRHRYSA